MVGEPVEFGDQVIDRATAVASRGSNSAAATAARHESNRRVIVIAAYDP